MTARTKVLLSAYGCEPDTGSEPGAGWEWCLAAAVHHDVWLVTRSNNVELVRAALDPIPLLDVHVVGYDLPRPLPWLKKRIPGGAHLYYAVWQYAVVPRLRRLHREVGFDVAHHVTWSTDWLPVGVERLDVPFVWGPIGGATRTPWRHWRWFGLRGTLAEAVRSAMIPAARRLLAHRSFRRASYVLAQNPDELRLVPAGAPVRVEPNVALHMPELEAADQVRGARRALFVGRLVYWKGPCVAVAALSHPEAAGWELDVYGVGPELSRARRTAQRLGVSERVRFHGFGQRREVLNAMARSHALLLPSFHDGAGWVVAEAAALGCAVVCLDTGGPPVLLGKRGRKVDLVSRDLGRSVAIALGSLGERDGVDPPADDRWSAARLPAVLADVYREAIARYVGGRVRE